MASNRVDQYSAQRALYKHIWVNSRTGCHEWRGTKDAGGLPVVYFRGQQWSAARTVWALAHDNVLPQSDELILTSCETRGCVNGDHLYTELKADDVRKRLGKISAKDESQIHALAKLGLTHKQIADKLGNKVTPRCIGTVARRGLGMGVIK